MYQFTKYFFLTGIIIISAACSDDNEPDIQQPGLYENGVFITNEGRFGEASGSLSFYDQESSTVTNNLFSVANPGQQLGDVVQSSHLAGDRLFLVVNNSNKVEVLDLKDSLEVAYTISGVLLPRYMVSHEGKGYLTEWVSFSDPGRVSIFDLETGEIEKSVVTGFGTEGIIIAGDKLFASNNFSTSLVTIDMQTEQVTDTIEVGSSPAGMVLDSEGDVWIVCAGGYDENYAPLNDGKLVELDPSDNSIIREVALNQNVNGNIAVSSDGEKIYYFSGTEIFSYDVSQSSAPEDAFIKENSAVGFWGIGVSKDGTIYVADAKGFAENGEIFRYTPDGSLIDKFTVGIGPNGFSFN